MFRADLLGSAEASWEELFAGCTALKAITFSSSLEMIMRMADRLADMEVVFGSESILSKEHLALTQASQTIQSYGFGDALIDQKALVEALSRFLGHAGSKLLERVVAGTLRFRLLRGRPSHEKLYLIQTRRRRSYGSAARPVAAVRQTPSSRQVRLAPDHEPEAKWACKQQISQETSQKTRHRAVTRGAAGAG